MINGAENRMIYEYSDKMKKIPLSEIDPAYITVGLITIEELTQNNQLFGFSETATAECRNKSFGFRGSIDNFENYSFGMLHIIDIGNIFGERDRIGFFIKKNFFCLSMRRIKTTAHPRFSKLSYSR